MSSFVDSNSRRAADLRLAERLARLGYVASARALVRRDTGVVVIEINAPQPAVR